MKGDLWFEVLSRTWGNVVKTIINHNKPSISWICLKGWEKITTSMAFLRNQHIGTTACAAGFPWRSFHGTYDQENKKSPSANVRCGNGLYNLFMVKLVMVCYCFTNIIFYIYVCVCVLRRYIQTILCTHHHRQLIKKEPLAISRVLLASQLGMID